MRHFTETKGYSLVELLVALAIAGLIGGAILGVYRVSQDTYIRASSLEAAQDGARAGLDRMANELRLIGSYWVGAATSTQGNAITDATATCISFLADVDADTVNVAGQEITLTAQADKDDTSISVNRTTGSIGGNAFTAGEWVYIANGAKREVKQIAAYENGTTIPLTVPLTSSIPNLPQPATVRSVETIKYYLDGTDLRRKNIPLSPCTAPEAVNGPGIVENVSGLTFTYFLSDGVTQTANAALIREIRIDLTVQNPDLNARRMTTRVKPRSLP